MSAYTPPSLYDFACSKILDHNSDDRNYYERRGESEKICEAFHDFGYVKRCDYCRLLLTGIPPREYYRRDLKEPFPCMPLNICNGCLNEHFEVLEDPNYVYDEDSLLTDSDDEEQVKERDERWERSRQWQEDVGITLSCMVARDKLKI